MSICGIIRQNTYTWGRRLYPFICVRPQDLNSGVRWLSQVDERVGVLSVNGDKGIRIGTRHDTSKWIGDKRWSRICTRFLGTLSLSLVSHFRFK